MNNTTKKFIQLATIMMALSVAFGAFGAHTLKDILVQSNMKEVYNTAVEYQFYHSLGLFIVGFIAHLKDLKIINLAGNIMFISIILFSGSLYAMTLTSIKTLGVITPIGGLGFIVSWLILTYSVTKVDN